MLSSSASSNCSVGSKAAFPPSLSGVLVDMLSDSGAAYLRDSDQLVAYNVPSLDRVEGAVPLSVTAVGGRLLRVWSNPGWDPDSVVAVFGVC